MDTYFVDHLCILCLVFLMILLLFIAALWSPARKGLTSWLLLVMFIVFLLLSHVVSWVRCGSWLYCFLIFAVFLTSNMQMFNFNLSNGLVRVYEIEFSHMSKNSRNPNLVCKNISPLIYKPPEKYHMLPISIYSALWLRFSLLIISYHNQVFD